LINQGDVEIVDFGFVSSITLSENFWTYIKYVAIALALIPIAVNLKDDYYSDEKHTLLSFFFLIGAIGIIYSMYREWSAIPSDGFRDYLKFAFYSFIFILIPFFNFIETPTGYFDVKSIYDYLSNGILCLLFLLWGFYAVIKAWISIPPDGYMYYFEFAGIFGLITLILAVALILNYKYNHEKSLGYLLNICLLLVSACGTIYGLICGWAAMPSLSKLVVYAVILLVIVGIINMMAGSTSDHSY
jgi:hypothetical protein